MQLSVKCLESLCHPITTRAEDARVVVADEAAELVGLARVMWPGTLQQIFIAIIFSLLSLVLLVLRRPYRDTRDQYLAVSTAFALACFFLCAILFKFAEEFNIRINVLRNTHFRRA